jgi:RimJ/RimL family protein N-acetyltransferase
MKMHQPVISFVALSAIASVELVRMLNDPDVRRHMPLAGDDWDETRAADWARAKDAQWLENGYGPWAIRIGGTFAGWGGFQKEGDEADLGLVLLPGHWGDGAAIFRELVRRGDEMGLTNVSILLPPSRVRMKGLARLGFVPAGEIEYAGHKFIKFKLAR